LAFGTNGAALTAEATEGEGTSTAAFPVPVLGAAVVLPTSETFPFALTAVAEALLGTKGCAFSTDGINVDEESPLLMTMAAGGGGGSEDNTVTSDSCFPSARLVDEDASEPPVA